MAAKISDVSKGWTQLLKLVKDFRGQVDVGIIGPKAGEQKKPGTGEDEAPPLTVAQVGAIHEFGLGDVPERSFIRGWVDAHRPGILMDQRILMVKIAIGELRPEQALNLLGVKYQAAIQERISDGIPPTNEQSTIDRKGSSKPLIDTGQLRQSITYRVKS